MKLLARIWVTYVLSGILGCLLLSNGLEFLLCKGTINDEYPSGTVSRECWTYGIPAILVLASMRLWRQISVRRVDGILLFAGFLMVLFISGFVALGMGALSKLHWLPASVTECLPPNRAWFQAGLLEGARYSAGFTFLIVVAMLRSGAFQESRWC